MSKKSERAAFGAGCFWHVQDAFDKAKGVLSTKAGYSGGTLKNPSYKDVSSGTTGHAEAVEVEFNPEVISYRELLDIFWNLHDPTQINRQGPDMGSQYRSVIFCYNLKQKKEAEKSKKVLEKSGKYKKPIATEIVKAEEFWPAEDYHQHYAGKTGKNSCRI